VKGLKTNEEATNCWGFLIRSIIAKKRGLWQILIRLAEIPCQSDRNQRLSTSVTDHRGPKKGHPIQHRGEKTKSVSPRSLAMLFTTFLKQPGIIGLLFRGFTWLKIHSLVAGHSRGDQIPLKKNTYADSIYHSPCPTRTNLRSSMSTEA
jgi:hypothetical protein